MSSGTIIVHPETPPERMKVTVCARVSSSEEKEDLSRRVILLKDHASANGWPVASVVDEVDSCLNGSRRKLLKILADPSVGAILVEHHDRLARFDVEYIEAAHLSQGRRIIVADETTGDGRHLGRLC